VISGKTVEALPQIKKPLSVSTRVSEGAEVEPATGAASRDQFRVGTTAIALAAVAILAKAMGFGEKVVIAHYFGTTPSADTYFAATSILLSAVFLVRELIYPTLLPTLSEAKTLSPGVFNDLFTRMFRWTMLLVLLAAAAGAVLMPQVVSLLAPGFPDHQRAGLARLLRWLLPAGTLMALVAVTYTTLNAKGRLVVASLAEAASKAALLVIAALLIPFSGLGAIPIAVLTGAAICLGIHLAVLRPSRVARLRLSPASGKLVGRTAALMAPIVIGVVFSHISDVVDNLLASCLPAGRLSCLNYAKKITDAILLAGPTALAVVLYARASRLASLSRHGELTELVGKGLRLLLFLGVPIACLMIELRATIVRALFEHGSFDPVSTAGVAGALLVYGLGLPTLSIEGLCTYAFYSMSDTRTPVTAGVLCVLLDIALAVLLARSMGYLGITTALVIAKTVKVVALLALLHRKLNSRLVSRQWVVFAIKLALAAAVMWLAVRLVGRHVLAARVGTIIALIGSCIVAAVVYVGTSILLGLKEPRLMIDSVPWRRLLNHRGGGER
jgi:putative peptidoglycan lipid II flippase